MASDGKSLALTGQGNSMPLLMDINTQTGSFNKFISLDYINASPDVVPTYETHGAIYYDKLDHRDNVPYFYTSFIKDGSMFIMRVLDSAQQLRVDWNFMFQDYST